MGRWAFDNYTELITQQNTAGSVSYTHLLASQYQLDVPKQKIVLDEPIKAYGTYEVKAKLGYEVSAKFSVSAVSYTHLDVYKRQSHGCARRSTSTLTWASFVTTT